MALNGLLCNKNNDSLKKIVAAIFIVGCLFGSFVAQSEKVEEPAILDADTSLWEYGVGAVGIWVPHYPGADQGQAKYLGAPFVIYRGETFRTDRGALRGRFFKNPRWQVDMSIGGAFPADSNTNDARRGMENLDWLGELGPRVVYSFLPPEHKNSFDFRWPVHFVFSTDFARADHRGYITRPMLTHRNTSLFGKRYILVARAGVTYSTRMMNEYFYEVTPEEETSVRPTYRAKAGLTETFWGGGLTWEIHPKLLIVSRFEFQIFEGVANESSPLLKDKYTYSGALAFIWRMGESKARGYK